MKIKQPEIRQVETELADVPITEILVSHHSHTDIGYTHEQPIVWELQNRYIDMAMDLAEETADYPAGSRFKWTCETTAPVIHWLRHASSSQIDRFVRLCLQGSIEVTALFCNMTPLYDLEETHRSLLPVQQLRTEFGIPVRTAMNSDVNGLPWPLVDVLLDSGITGLTMGLNEQMGGVTLRRPYAFRWRGPSGRSLVTYNGLHYGHLQRYGLGETSVEEAFQGICSWLADYPNPSGLPLLYVQNTRKDHWDNNPPQEKLAPFVRTWNEAGLQPRLTLVTPTEAISRLSACMEPGRPEHAGDWTDFWNFGSGSSIEPLRINRRSRRSLVAADTLRSLHATKSSYHSADLSLAQQAWWQLMLFDEHTWGAHCSISEPGSELTRAEWAFKDALANEADSFSRFARRRAIAELSEQVGYDGPTPAVLVYNPLARTVTRRVAVPASWHDPTLPATLTHQHLWDTAWRHQEKLTAIGPVTLPPLGWTVVPLISDHTGSADVTWDPQTGILCSPHYQICFHPDHQGVLSWVDLATGEELVDTTAPYIFGQIVLEQCTSLQDRSAFWSNRQGNRWHPDWPARRLSGVPAAPLEVTQIPGGLRLSQRVLFPGFPELSWSLAVHTDTPAVEVTICGNLPDHTVPEALYLVFPLRPVQAVPQRESHPSTHTNLPADTPPWRAWFTTAGQRVEYHTGQLPGSCRDFVTTDTWVYLEPGTGQGMQIVCPDNPLFMFGGFHFAQHLQQIPPQAPPWLLAWVCNTYWQTNFRASQPGPFIQRYWLIPQNQGASDATLWETADELLVEPVTHPMPRPQSGRLPSSGQSLLIATGPVRLLACKEAEVGEGLVMRFHNPTPENQIVHIGPATLTPVQAWCCNALEEKDVSISLNAGCLDLTVPAQCTATFLIKLR